MMRDHVGAFPRPGAVLAALAIGLLLGGGGVGSAQERTDFWNSSLEPAAGTPVQLLSAPDTLVPAGSDERLDPASLDPGPKEWRVVGTGLKPRENDVSYSTSVSGGCGYVTAGDASTVWNVTPNLPDGAVIDRLRMYYDDTSASNSTAWFTVYDLYGDLVQEWSVSSNTAAGNSFNDSGPINHTVNYSLYSYLINWRPVVSGSTMQLCGFRVFHTVPLSVPGAPLGLTASVSGRTVSLTWNPPGTGGAASGYVLQAGSAPGLSNLANQAVAAPGFVAAGVPPGTYYVRVRGTNAAGTGAPTADVTVVVP